ncbi:MAG: UbiA prenyltransferase family protein [Thaumarchaeota archaeon]|nr:UbiA prenyltransferase family protein [Nitrososphaerota archaeon]
MRPVRPWLALLRFEEYGPLFLLAGLAGSLYAGSASPVGLFGLLAFIGLFSASAFVLNDVVDWREDSLSTETRNPLSLGELGRSSAVAVFVLLSAGSVAALYFIRPPALYAAPLVYGLYWGYSWGPKFKTLPVVDIAVHGVVPALFVVMGYAISAPPSAGTYLLAGVVFCLAAMSGVLQEVRDLGKDSAFGKTSATRLGMGRSVGLAELLVVSGVALIAVSALTGVLPLGVLALTPLGYLLVSPLRALKSGNIGAAKAISEIRLRGLLLTVVLFAAYLAFVYLPF